MLDLLFSFQGRVKRAKFFFTSLIAGMIVGLSLLLLLAGPISEAFSTHGKNIRWSDLDIDGPIAFMALFVFGAGVWVQMSLVWKRTRDMSESMTVAYTYAACWVLSFIPLLGLIFGMVNAILALMLLFKSSRATGDDSINPEVFGDRSEPGELSTAPATDFASQLSDSDLIARAAQLREPTPAPSMVTPQAPVQNTPRAAPKSFGRRSSAQH